MRQSGAKKMRTSNVAVVNVRVFTGSRNAAPSINELDKALDGADLVLVGDCETGTDRAVLDRARHREIDVRIYVAKWSTTKPRNAAGPIRNERMADEAATLKRSGANVRCFAYPKGRSRGTRGCIRLLKKRGLSVRTEEL